MEEGLIIIQVRGTYYRSVTICGYIRRINGDEWLMEAGARVVLRTSGDRPLHDLALNGPGKDHRLLAPGAAEYIHRLLLLRAMPADLKAWGEHIERTE